MTEKEEKPKKKKVIRIIMPSEPIVFTQDKYFTMEIDEPNENAEKEIKEGLKELMECEIE